jgi:catechol 2,3-dioxygenase-like lactoylglutathione lyase family enzyme
MLGKADATPMIAVTDLDRARTFYEGALGLKTKDEWGEGVTLESGDTLINLYKSEFAGTNKATALNFDVDDIDKEVSELKGKGVFFEKYDLPGLEPRGDLYVGEGGFKTAWFKDPDGNILSLIEEA